MRRHHPLQLQLSEDEASVLSCLYSASGRCRQLGPLVDEVMVKRSLTRRMAYDVLWSLRRKGLVMDGSLTKRGNGRTYEVSVLELTENGEKMFRPAYFNRSK